MSNSSVPLRDAFIAAACVPLEGSHASGTLEQADAILAAHPEVARADIHTAAILGDEAGMREFLARNPASAIAKVPPRGWDALTHLCFSRYLRLDRARSANFVRTAQALLEAGASANTGWFENDHQPRPVWESALYGAAGVAHDPGLTRLLLAHGADPNDEETPYHTPETYDNGALRALVESGQLTAESLATLLLRKADWHDHDGIVYLLEHGADPNRLTRWHHTAFQQALRRDNAMEIIDTFLDHGAQPTLGHEIPGHSALAIAARRGRGDVLASLARRRVSIRLEGIEQLLAACALDDAAGVRTFVERAPDIARQLQREGGRFLAEFAGNGNTAGVRQLLDLGVPVDARYAGDGYYGIAAHSTALHVAAWRIRPSTVKLLLERGAPVDARDGHGQTPLALAVRASIDSYWSRRRSPEPIAALLAAGATRNEITVPTGWQEADALLSAAAPTE